MPTALMEFKVDGRTFAQAKRKLAAMRERAGNVQAAWNVFLDWFTDGNRAQFASQGQRWRTPWRELAPATLKEKDYLGYPTDTLVRERILERSVTDRPLGLERLGPHDMTAGTLVDYAPHHHFGAPRARIPARPLWNVKQIKEEGAATSAVKTWIVDGRSRVDARKSR
jgi:hypothetical protein